MSYHVDVISNELMSGEQRLLGRVHLDDGAIHVEAVDEDQLRDTLKRIVPDIDPDEDPMTFLVALPERVDYTYMVANSPHESDECPFHGGPGATIKIAETQPHRSAQAA